MSIDVRPCASVDELRRAAVITRYFGRVWDDERAAAFARKLGVERMLAAWDGEEVVGGAGAFPFELSVPGGRSVRAGGVTIVGVLPTHRRRGVLTSLMRAQLDDLHARGEPVAYLWASEGTIYGRFGYGVASLQLGLDLPRERTAYAAPLEPYGAVRLVEREEALAAFPAVYARQFEQRPGMFARSPDWWADRTLPAEPTGPPQQRVLLELDGRAEGYAVYQVHQSWEHGSSTGHVEVQEAVATGPRALASVWRYLLDLDWTSRIRAGMLPADHPLVLLLAEPRRAGLRVADALWVRLVDVGAALSARGYASDEQVVFELRDAFCPWNEGRWRLGERTDAEPDLRLDVSALGSAYLGGFTFRQLADALRVEELTPDAVDRADRIFRAVRAPWCPEIF